MSGRQATRAENQARREAEREARRQHWLEVDLPKRRAEVRSEVERRGLASFMNDTRWRALCEAVQVDLTFPPGFQFKPVVGEADPEPDIEALTYLGAWSELEPFFEIEWLRVVPRYRQPVGALVSDEIVDATDAFRDILVRLGVAFREDEARTFWIYGYAPADPATLTSPPEKPT